MMTCDICGDDLNAEHAWRIEREWAAHDACKRSEKVAAIEEGMHRHYCHLDGCDKKAGQ